MTGQREVFIAFDPLYAHPLPEGHRFPMLKYELIPQQLCYEGLISEGCLFSPSACTDETLLLTHTPDYLEKLRHQKLSAQEERRIGFPQSPGLTRRELVITQGTIDCCHHALQNGISLNVAGGTHHAFADRGEGFCLLNDFAVAANYLLKAGMAARILIIDLDVHQGNGTASLFRDNPHVFTFSMHGQHNYPFHKEKSDWDIPLPDATGDDAYLEQLSGALPLLMERFAPDMVFYLSGVDVLETDRFGKLRLSLRACQLRDEMVFRAVRQHDLPCVVAMGGGYSPQVRTIVDAHCNTFRAALDIFGL